MKIKKLNPLLFFFLFLLTVLVPAQAVAISLGELIETNGSIEVGDKLFSDFATNRPFLQVEGRTFSGNAGLGFMSTGNIPSGVTPLPSNISFTVTALDPNFRITAFSSAVGTLPTGTGTVLIIDTALDLGTVSVLGSGSIFTTGLPINGTLPIINTVPLSQAVQSLRFLRTVQFTGPSSGDRGFNMSVTQKPLPEPSTILLFGSGGLAALSAWRWKKNGAG